jgi:hypothetical protein
MIRAKEERNEKPVIDLTGPDGNAFVLMAMARRYANQLGLDGTKIIEEMMSGDYENLLQVFDRNFGEWVILER